MLLPDVPSAEDILADQSASRWIKDALASALVRDPVDAANDAMILANILDTRASRMLFAASVSNGEVVP